MPEECAAEKEWWFPSKELTDIHIGGCSELCESLTLTVLMSRDSLLLQIVEVWPSLPIKVHSTLQLMHSGSIRSSNWCRWSLWTLGHTEHQCRNMANELHTVSFTMTKLSLCCILMDCFCLARQKEFIYQQHPIKYNTFSEFRSSFFLFLESFSRYCSLLNNARIQRCCP